MSKDDLSTAFPEPAKSAAVETVRLQPYYPPEEPPYIGYRAVEVSGTTPASAPQPRTVAPWTPCAFDDGDFGQILADARRELRLLRDSPPRNWPLERNIWQCLRYPLQAFWGIVCLGLLGAISMLILATVLPMRAVRDDVGDLTQALLLAVFVFVILAPQMGITWSFLRQVLRSAVLGKTDLVSRTSISRSPNATVHAALMMPVTFLAGPIVLLAAAMYFWVHAGKLEWLDHLLLWQLWLATGVSWTYLLLAVEARGRLRDAHAKAAASLFYRQGWPALLFPIVLGTTLTVFVYLSVRTWILLLDEGFAAFALQFLLWCTALYCWTFLMRWYGVSRYWRRQARHSRPA